jgi:tRNA pseudouridine55 synthase
MNGVLVIDKPSGWTSHDVVNQVRRLVGERRIGHTGTLDPLATGVLVLCAGKGTRIVRYLESDDKIYTAVFRLGITTDTQDADGRSLEVRSYRPPARKDLEDILAGFVGTILQRPPAFSALKVNGIPSYRLARSGTVHRHPERTVTIHELVLLDYDDPAVRIRVHCSKGTYIRTLCADIGERIGSGAHVTELKRERAGLFGMDRAVSLEQLRELAKTGNAGSLAVSLNDALRSMPVVSIPAADAARIRHGNVVSRPSEPSLAADGGRVRIHDQDGDLIAVGLLRQDRIVPETVLV